MHRVSPWLCRTSIASPCDLMLPSVSPFRISLHPVPDQLDDKRAHRPAAEWIDHRARAPVLRELQPVRRSLDSKPPCAHRTTGRRGPRVLCAECATPHAGRRPGCPWQGTLDSDRWKLRRRLDKLRYEQVRAASLRSMAVAQCGRCSKSDIFYAGYASSAVVQAIVYVQPYTQRVSLGG